MGYTTSEGSARAIIAERVLCILTNSGA